MGLIVEAEQLPARISEDVIVVSPYLQRPLRTLEQALRDCGRAREEAAMVVTLPRGRRIGAACCDDGEDEVPREYPAERVGASA